ncbi:hypothetical protein NONO_c09770 [Nocardia nova SH22a]|uniref:Lipoprotein n=1 Tax=Nocardia nova SH22a TaxID=1415166 RepID=W5T9G3_9NOCA|nr:hypothetical protein [Nocardia nova]AHH15784.1 hypothetical protein NONO_c09770 [Nocardia nova SH22a]
MKLLATTARFVTTVGMTVALVSSAACGSDSDAVTDPVVDLTKLDLGAYQGKPADLGLPKNMYVARFMEANRLGDVLPLPHEVDPNLTVGEASETHAFLDVGKEFHLGPIFRWLHEENFNSSVRNYVGGFATSASSNEAYTLSYELVSSALLFSDPESARVAAGELSKADFYGDVPVEPTALEKYPDSVARWQPAKQLLTTWTANDKYVIITNVINHENAELGVSDPKFLTDLAAKSIAATTDSLRNFKPTPVDQLMKTPVDPDNVRSLALRRPTGDSFINIPGTFDLHGAMQFAPNPKILEKAYRDNGVDRVAFDAGELVRAKDSAAAQKIFEERSAANRLMRKVESPKGLPNAVCLNYKGPDTKIRYYCHVRYGRYAAVVFSQQLLDAQQRISAQYSILANSK